MHRPYPRKIGMPRFDVQVEEVEDDPMRQVTKTAIIDGNSLASIIHLQAS